MWIWVLGFRLGRNRTDDLGIKSSSLWPTDPRLHVRSDILALPKKPPESTPAHGAAADSSKKFH